jgi:transcriptional regulator with XRE-family HTH domain
MAKEKKAKGRPSIFNDAVKEQVVKMYEMGLSDAQVAGLIGVTPQTIGNWKKDESFFESLKEAKLLADECVEACLYKRATGYTHREEKVFCNANGEVTKVETVKHYAPDVTAQIFWLKNRQPAQWREKQEVEVTGNPIQIKIDQSDEKL